ncbi:MAG: hypothetical protein AB1589_01535 [Cyanobacteriota bacterium]
MLSQKADGRWQMAKGDYWYLVVWAVKESPNLYGDSYTSIWGFHIMKKGRSLFDRPGY